MADVQLTKWLFVHQLIFYTNYVKKCRKK